MPNAGAISTIQAQLDAERYGLASPMPPMGSLGPYTHSRGGAGAYGSPTAFEGLIQEAAQKHDLDPKLIKAVIQTESNFNPNAVSRAGAKGLMQIMDFNSRAMGVKDPFDPAQNVDAGARILRGQLNHFGDLSKAIAAYNAGGPTVDRYGGIPPYRETQTYVARVLNALRGYNEGNSESAAASASSGKENA